MENEKVGTVYVDLAVNDKNYDKQINSKIKGTENAFSGTMKKIGGFIAGAFAVKKVVDFTQTAINSASQVQSAFTGLNSIVQGTGNSFSIAQKFINEYTKDGLVSIEETATAYKNLLSRGYDTSQIEDVMNRLKDSAAFGRQASYDLGEAVVSATEGLKNENSILVDNAGVTKNVAKMWEEWAKAHNTTTAAMTQAQKIEAEYNGIMKETRFQIGDATAYTKTFGGQLQQLKFNFSQMTVAIGKVVTPLAQLFIPILNSAITAVTNFFNVIQSLLKSFGIEMPNVVSKSSSYFSGMASDIESTGDSAVAAAKKINKSFGDMDELHILNTSNSNSNTGNENNPSVGNETSIPIIPTAASDNSISTAVDSTIEKIRKYIEPLQNINFDNLINAFSNLWDSLKPFGQAIGNGLSDFYFNLLVPLSQWTIEDFLPDFLNATAEAISKIDFDSVNDSLNSLWDELKPFSKTIGKGLLSFYKELLLPLSRWTISNVLPSFLDILSGALAIINQAFKDVQPLFSWFWEQILKPIASWTGGVIVDVLNGIGDTLQWISENEIAMTIIESLASVIGAVAIAIGIYNAAMATCNIVTGTFSGIMAVLTSPITLVVAAVAGLIAVVALLIKHWDDVTSAASECWEWIKGVWNSAATWFDETIIQPICNFFSGMWDGLKDGASQAWEGIKNVFGGVVSWFQNIFSTAWRAVKNVFSVGGKVFDGIKEGIIEAFKFVVNGLIDGINKVVSIPFKGLNGILDTIHDIDILGAKPFGWLTWRAPIPQLPHLFNGSWFPKNDPQLAIVGDNKREPEIVTPESKIYDQVDKAIKNNNSITKQTIEIHLYHHYEDGRTIIQKINQEQIDAGEILLLT